MTTPATPRVAGKRGRLRSERVALRTIHEYATEPLPAPSYPVDVRGGIPDHAWGMLGNGPDPACTTEPDGVGDCGFAGRQHARMAKAACYGLTETWETSNELVAEYLAYDNGQDIGVSLPAVLLAWYKAGKILAFAPVDHTDPAAIDSAMQAFKGVYAGVDLTDDADPLFVQGQPWTTADGEQPDPNDGHCIVKVTAAGNGGNDGWITWGAYQESTAAWTQACLTEAYVIVTTEDEAAKVDMPRLLADIEALGGTGGSPQPAPKGNTVFAAIEAKLAQIWDDVTGEARAELEQLLADAKAELAKFGPLLGQFGTDLRTAIADLAPEVRSAIEALLAKLLADAAPLLGKEDEPGQM